MSDRTSRTWSGSRRNVTCRLWIFPLISNKTSQQADIGKKNIRTAERQYSMSEFQLVLEQMWAFCVLVTICSITQSSPWNDDPSVRFALPRRARLRRRHRTIRYNTPPVHVLGQVSRTRPRCRSKRAKQKSLRGLPGYGARLKVCRLNSKGRSKSKVW